MAPTDRVTASAQRARCCCQVSRGSARSCVLDANERRSLLGEAIPFGRATATAKEIRADPTEAIPLVGSRPTTPRFAASLTIESGVTHSAPTLFSCPKMWATESVSRKRTDRERTGRCRF